MTVAQSHRRAAGRESRQDAARRTRRPRTSGARARRPSSPGSRGRRAVPDRPTGAMASRGTTREVMSCSRPGGAASFPPENFQPGGSNMVVDRFSLKGKVAAVTGGGQGIGAATAQALGEAGAAVAILDLGAARAEASAGRLRGRGNAAEGLALGGTSSRGGQRGAAALER